MVSIPHGGTLINRVVEDGRRERLIEEAGEMPSIALSFEKAIDVENIAYGVYSPIKGFMTLEECSTVLENMRLPNGLPWTIPVILDVGEKDLASTKEGDEVALTLSGRPIAVMRVEEVFKIYKEFYAQSVFGTTDPKHPGVSRVMAMKNQCVGGPLQLIGNMPNEYERYTLYPSDTRALFVKRNWRTIAGFQTRNVPHLGHEYTQKSVLVFVDGVFVNPVIGRKKTGDFRDAVILEAYEALMRNYYPKDTIALGILRYEMKYAGPKEAIHHAIIRKNFGCTHFIVGRDHAGVENYYKPYDAWDIFKEFPDLGIMPIFIKELFYCRRCSGVANDKVCPHSEEHKVRFSGTKIREMMIKGVKPPPELMRPEVVDVLLKFENPFVEE
ncbi:MAG: sulfate adenylyltransferase [Candidatus Bathyarchaeia archaeon]